MTNFLVVKIHCEKQFKLLDHSFILLFLIINACAQVPKYKNCFIH